MTSYIQNYGFTKTMIQDNEQIKQNVIQWKGNYDGNIANINVGINDNGNTEIISMQLTNDDLFQLLGVQPVQMSLEKRILNDYLSDKQYKQYKPITLEGALIKKKSRKHRKRHTNKRRKSYRNRY
jgi:hypothetical protein